MCRSSQPRFGRSSRTRNCRRTSRLATRIGVTGHVCTEEQYETMRDAGAFDEDAVTGATDAILFERARALLLGSAALDDLR